jgi:hypothetical protein
VERKPAKAAPIVDISLRTPVCGGGTDIELINCQVQAEEHSLAMVRLREIIRKKLFLFSNFHLCQHLTSSTGF